MNQAKKEPTTNEVDDACAEGKRFTTTDRRKLPWHILSESFEGEELKRLPHGPEADAPNLYRVDVLGLQGAEIALPDPRVSISLLEKHTIDGEPAALLMHLLMNERVAREVAAKIVEAADAIAAGKQFGVHQRIGWKEDESAGASEVQ